MTLLPTLRQLDLRLQVSLFPGVTEKHVALVGHLASELKAHRGYRDVPLVSLDVRKDARFILPHPAGDHGWPAQEKAWALADWGGVSEHDVFPGSEVGDVLASYCGPLEALLVAGWLEGEMEKAEAFVREAGPGRLYGSFGEFTRLAAEVGERFDCSPPHGAL